MLVYIPHYGGTSSDDDEFLVHEVFATESLCQARVDELNENYRRGCSWRKDEAPYSVESFSVDDRDAAIHEQVVADTVGQGDLGRSVAINLEALGNEGLLQGTGGTGHLLHPLIKLRETTLESESRETVR